MTLDLTYLAGSLKVTEEQLREVLDALGVSAMEIPATINGTGTFQYLLQLKSAAKSQNPSISFLEAAKQVTSLANAVQKELGSQSQEQNRDNGFDPRKDLERIFVQLSAGMPGGPYTVEYAEGIGVNSMAGITWSTLLMSISAAKQVSAVFTDATRYLTEKMIFQTPTNAAYSDELQSLLNPGELRTNFMQLTGFRQETQKRLTEQAKS